MSRSCTPWRHYASHGVESQRRAASLHAVEQKPKQIGHYEVESELGRGGMGVVYLGRDARLGRLVAIKSISQVSRSKGSATLISQLQHEARVLAAVNHPNVAQIFSIETDGDSSYLILEYIQGPTLAQRMRDGAIPLRETLRIARGFVEGLWAAHRRGIVHRDFKPANLKFTSDGTVKILDFGLALHQGESASGHVSPRRDRQTAEIGEFDAPTASVIRIPADRDAAQTFVSGTPGYMSPEQVSGKAADHRADIWAVGCVLFEMLSGGRAFPGDTTTAVLRATLHSDPDLERLPPETPPVLRRLIRSALSRELTQRPTDMGVVLSMIEEAAAEVGLASSAASARAELLTETPNNLPRTTTSFVGREAELARLSTMLLPGRVVTLVGLGGSGKTRLALRLAESSLASFPDGVWFIGLIQLAPSSAAEEVADIIGRSIGVRGQANVSAVDLVASYFRGRRTLLILDNAEHVTKAVADLVRALLDAQERDRPSAAILVTSREAIDIEGEWCVGVGALDLTARAEDADGLSEAARLFAERAAAARPGFTTTAEDRVALESLCTRLDGIPLAIELAAARTRLLSIQQILTRLEDRFRLLGQAPSAISGESGRLRGLEESIVWSVSRLSQADRLLLETLTIFSGGWTLESCADVVGPDVGDEFTILEGLAHLVDLSVVRTQGGTTTAFAPGLDSVRYDMPETIREFALGMAETRPDWPDQKSRLITRHSQYFLNLSRAAARGIHGPEVRVWFQRLEADHGNFQAIGERINDPVVRLTLWTELWEAWWNRGWWSEALRNLRESLAAVNGAAARTHALHPVSDLARLIAAGTLGCGVIERSMGEYDHSRRDLFRALELARESLPEPWSGPTSALALNHIGGLDIVAGQHGRALTAFEEALAISRGVSDHLGAAYALNNLGNLFMDRGHFAEARKRHEEALTIRKRLGDLIGQAGSYNNLGNLTMDEGRHALSRNFYEDALAINRRLGLTLGIAINLNNLAYAAMAEEDLDAAEKFLRQAVPIWRRMGDRRGLSATLNNLGIIAARQGRRSQALSELIASLSIRVELQDLLGVAESFEAMAYPSLQADPLHVAALLGLADRIRGEMATPILPVDRERYDHLKSGVIERCGGLSCFNTAWIEGQKHDWQTAARNLLAAYSQRESET